MARRRCLRVEADAIVLNVELEVRCPDDAKRHRDPARARVSLDISQGFLGNAINRLGALITDIRGGRIGTKFAADAGVIEKPGEQARERGTETRFPCNQLYATLAGKGRE